MILPIIQPQIKQTSSETSIHLHVALKSAQEEERREVLIVGKKKKKKAKISSNKKPKCLEGSQKRIGDWKVEVHNLIFLIHKFKKKNKKICKLLHFMLFSSFIGSLSDPFLIARLQVLI